MSDIPETQAPVVITQRPLTIADIDVDLSNKAVQRHLERHNNIVAFAKAVLVQDRDYGPAFPGAKQNALRKTGADTLMGTLGLRAEYEILPESVIDDKTPYYKYVVKCRIFHGDYEMGQDQRSCSSKEKKYQYRWAWENELRTDPDLRGLDLNSLPKRQKGQYTQYRVPNPEIEDLENTILAMATKRARVAALLAATGLSSDFCDEVIDAERRAYDDQEEEPPPPKEPKKPAKGTKAQQQSHDPEKGRILINEFLAGNYGLDDGPVLLAVQGLLADLVSDDTVFYELDGEQTAAAYAAMRSQDFQHEVDTTKHLVESLHIKTSHLRACRNVIAEMLTNGLVLYDKLSSDDLKKMPALVQTDEFRKRLRQEGIPFSEGQ